jgi:hypothetical protein
VIGVPFWIVSGAMVTVAAAIGRRLRSDPGSLEATARSGLFHAHYSGGYYISFVDSAGGSLSFFPNIRSNHALYIIFYLAKTQNPGYLNQN